MKLPRKAPTFAEILLKLEPKRFTEILQLNAGPAPQGRYRHWDTLRHVAPPTGFTSEEWWAAIKFARMNSRRDVPLLDATGSSFFYTTPDPVLEMLHTIDRDASGRIAVPDSITPQTRDRYIQSSLIEEAITSSQLALIRD